MRRQEISTLELPAGKKDHMVPDSIVPGLALRLREGGSRTWVFSYRVGIKQRRMTLGSASVISVQEARRKATQLYASAKLGIDPALQKAKARTDAVETIKAKLPLYLARQQDRVREGHLRRSSYIEIERHLLVHAKRQHAKPLAEVTRRDVATVLSALPERLSGGTVNRVQTTLSGFFAWTIREGLIDSNPVEGTERREEGERTRLIIDVELRHIWAALRDDAYSDILRLLILTGARREEIGGLHWREVDLTTRCITLPPERTKNRREHEIYLSDSALNILRSRPVLTQADGTPSKCVFGRGQQGFNDWAGSKNDLDRRIAEARRAVGADAITDWTLHDFRRMISTAMHDRLGIMPHVVEAVLGHVGHQGGIAGRYNRALYRAEKAAALNRWAHMVSDILEGRVHKVIPIRA
jgi:integrase